MHSDVVNLRDFYASPLGSAVRRLLSNQIRARWRSVAGLSVFGHGFAAPYLGQFRSEALRLGALMPGQQGALAWPASGPYQTVLVDEERLPLPDAAVDRLLAVHSLEAAERARPLLRELWRVLAPEGRLLAIVPNRRGLWARLDSTPFGSGQPYSRGQLDGLLRDALFTPLDFSSALYMPPVDRRLLVRSPAAWDRFGARVAPAFAGVILVEARKEMTAIIGGGKPARVRREISIARAVGLSSRGMDVRSQMNAPD